MRPEPGIGQRSLLHDHSLVVVGDELDDVMQCWQLKRFPACTNTHTPDDEFTNTRYILRPLLMESLVVIATDVYSQSTILSTN